MAASVPTITLNDGRTMPRLGFGCWQIPEAEAPDVVGEAIRAGYRLIDTAAVYGNEVGVGRAVRESGLPRADLFVTTKLWNDRQGRDAARKTFDESLGRLGLDHVDLYLIHWPCPQRRLFAETWKALVGLREEGRAKSIGVSNFTPENIAEIVGETGVAPAVNQIERHPRFQRRDPQAAHASHGIVTEAWSPLGQGKDLSEPVLAEIARAHGRTPAQVVLRWQVQSDCVPIPKTSRASRMAENIAVFDFELTAPEMDRIAALDRPDGRIGPDPATFC